MRRGGPAVSSISRYSTTARFIIFTFSAGKRWLMQSDTATHHVCKDACAAKSTNSWPGRLITFLRVSPNMTCTDPCVYLPTLHWAYQRTCGLLDQASAASSAVDSVLLQSCAALHKCDVMMCHMRKDPGLLIKWCLSWTLMLVHYFLLERNFLFTQYWSCSQ